MRHSSLSLSPGFKFRSQTLPSVPPFLSSLRLWRSCLHRGIAWEMEWWEKVMVPMRRAWIAFIARVRTRNNGSGLLKLHDDVQMCAYQDVQVMWEMLNRPEVVELSCRPKPKQPIPFGKLLFWSSGNHASDHV